MIRFKRGANPGKGKEYEINVITLMSLRLFLLTDQEDFDNFDLGFNLKDMGKFDDLVIVLKKNGSVYKTMAVQLKHKEDNRQLTVDTLNSDKGDFSLVAYAESTKNIIKKCDLFILFSNIKFDSKEKEMTEFHIKEDEDPSATSFLNTSIHSPHKNFIFEPKKKSELLLFDKFLKKFLLSPNQSNKQKIKQFVQEVFEKTYSARNSTEEYVNLVSAWYDHEIIKDVTENEPKLDKFRVGKLLVICLLNPFLVNVQPDDAHANQWNVFKKNSKQFLVTEVDANIVKTWTSPLKEKNYELWREDNIEPIIVKIDDVKLSRPILEAIKIIKKINLNKKLIIIGKVEDLDENSIDKFTNLFQVQGKLQQKDSSIAQLNKIMDAFNVPQDDDGLMNKDDVLKTTTPTILFRLIDKLKQDQEKLEYYVSRTMKVPFAIKGKSPQIISIKDEDLLQQHHSRINILCAEPGMGKTTLLKFFHNQFVEHNYYSKIISFKDHVKFFKDYKNTQSIESILKYFLNIKNNINEESLHIQSYLIRSRVCLLFDGLDELDSIYLTNAINCMQKVLTSPQIYKIFISAREHLKEDLVREFQVNIITINSIDKNKQIKYIRERLLPLSDENFNINDIIETIYNNFSFIQENDKLLGIPLQLYIITEVLIFNSNESVKTLLVLSKLYDKFINGKLEHLQKKTIKHKNLYELYNLEKHEMFALKACLDSNDFSKLINSENYDSTVQDFKNSCGLQAGIVLDFTENNTALFEHQTIPEYLCASYFIKNCKQNTEFAKFIFNSKYKTIRYFMDMKLAENSELHLAVLYCQHELILAADIQNIQNARDDAQRNLLQLCICYGKNYPPLKQKKNKKNVYEEPKRITSDSELKLYNHLCQHCNLKKEKDELFGWSSVEYAISFNNLCAIESIFNFDKKNETLITNCLKSDASIIGYSCIKGFKNLLDICSDNSIKSNIYSIKNNKYQLHYTQAIHLAAKAGQLCILKKIIKHIFDINCQDNRKNIALHYAAQYGHVQCLKELIKLPNLDINCQNNDEDTALHLAAQNQHAECLKELIKLPNLDINCQNKDGNTALHLVAQYGYVECLEELIKLPNLNINCQNKDENTALHLVAQNKNVECFLELIKMPNLDINSKNKYGNTAMHNAIQNKKVEYLKELIKLPNLDINCQNKDGNTALHLVAQYGYAECLEEFIKLPNLDINCQNKRGITALFYGAQNKNPKCLEVIIKLPNLDINCQNKHGNTALHCATKNKNVKCLEELIKMPSLDINCQNKNKSTALHFAAENKNVESFKKLIKLPNLDINCKNKYGNTAMHIAIQNKKLEYLKELIKLPNFDINCQDRNGNTALHLVAQYGYAECLEELIKLPHLDINCQNKRGNTALHYAIQNKNVKCLDELIKLPNLDIDCQDKDGNTAMHFAAKNKNMECLKKLSKLSNLNINCQNKHAKTPMHRHCKYNFKTLKKKNVTKTYQRSNVHKYK